MKALEVALYRQKILLRTFTITVKLREGFSQAFVYNCSKHRLATKHHPRAACGIELSEVLVVTGGMETQSRVTAYNEDGFLADLPSLGQGRYNHACGHFVNTDNKMVGNLPTLTSSITSMY